MGFIKKEFIIKPDSIVLVDTVCGIVQSSLDILQDDLTNKNLSGQFIDYFMADIYDMRDGNIYRVFSKNAMKDNSITTLKNDVINKIDIVTSLEIQFDEVVIG